MDKSTLGAKIVSYLVLAPLLSPCFPAHAALSPYWQRVTEMQAIAGDQGVADKLEAKGPIEAIEATGPDAYAVKAGGCTLEVTIVDAPPKGEPMPGPRQFAVRVGALSCP